MAEKSKSRIMPELKGDRKTRLANAVKGINTMFGPGTIGTAEEKKEELKIRFYPTPSMELNNALYGGFMVGRIMEIFGPHGIGKTSLAMEVITYNQKLDPEFNAAWFETEESFDYDYAKVLGMDMDRITIWEQKDRPAEDGLDILRIVLGTGAINMIVVNSIAGMAPKKEITDDMGDQNVALTARLMSKLLRVITGVASKNDTTVVFINQLREKIGAYGNPETTPGGRALGFYASQRLSVNKSYNEGQINAKLGGEVRVKTIKNRGTYYNPYTECFYTYEYGKGIQPLYEIPALIESQGIVTKGGSWYNFKDPEIQELVKSITGDIKINGKTNLVNILENSPELADKLLEMIYENIQRAANPTALPESEAAELAAAEQALDQEFAGQEPEAEGA